MSELINLTPHPIRVYRADGPSTVEDVNDGVVAVIEPTRPSVRVGEIDLGRSHGVWIAASDVTVPVQLIQYGEVDGLPEQRHDVFLIVPLVVILALASKGGYRRDLISPTRMVRNTEGTVVGCRAFATPC